MLNVGAPAAETPPSRTWQFSKTKLCKFEIIGMCTKGESCPFAHDKEELKPLPDLACTKLCKTLIHTGACNIKGCKYAHCKEELRSTSTFHKTKLCRFSQVGHCALGSKCNFAHSASELKQPSGGQNFPGTGPGQEGLSPLTDDVPQDLDSGSLVAEDEGWVDNDEVQKEYYGRLPQFLMSPELAEVAGISPCPPGVTCQASLARRPRRRRGGRGARDRAVRRGANRAVDDCGNQGCMKEDTVETNTVSRIGDDVVEGVGPSVAVAGVLPARTGLKDWLNAPSVPRQGGATVTRVPPGHVLIPGSSGVGARSLDSYPAYVTQTASDFVVKNTFLELGGAGRPLRPIRSAAGRLDQLDGHCESRDLVGVGRASSFGDFERMEGLSRHFQRHADDTDVAGGVGDLSQGDFAVGAGQDRMSLGPVGSVAAGGVGKGNMQATFMATQGAVRPYGVVEEPPVTEWPHAGREDDMWQVKNTFLSFSPQTKPMRTVRTAEGALCVLADDDR
eukprot:CAMPEP_0170617106 /NCGR_PEP_ID=MMETSP0224-20130122/26230_1 /TAXON_ID=285029 /ORGANISM="Togula jolla, Strain CCCM 725" /LENGTH=503 /DNA_ID=CAMNT_0010942955 /DNA_START=139 /DNA_END=1650 /DNA_ORIENTATION=+